MDKDTTKSANRRAKLFGYLVNIPLADVLGLDTSAEARDALAMAGDEMAFFESRCGFPDQADAELAKANPIDVAESLEMNVRDATFYCAAQRQLTAVAESNWPTACRGQLRYGRTFNNLPGLSADETDKVWHGIVNNWTAASSDLVMDAVTGITSDWETLDIYAGLRRLGGSTLAWQTLAVNRCDVSLEGVYDNDRSWTMNMATTTGTHEVGHGLGHQHTRDGSSLMYPSINSSAQARHGYPNSTDLRQHQNLGYSLSGRTDQLTTAELWNPRNAPEPPIPPDPPTPVDPDDIEAIVRQVIAEMGDLTGPRGERGPIGLPGPRGPAGDMGPSGRDGDGLTNEQRATLEAFAVATGKAFKNGNWVGAVKVNDAVAAAASALLRELR